MLATLGRIALAPFGVNRFHDVLQSEICDTSCSATESSQCGVEGANPQDKKLLCNTISAPV